MAFAEYLMQAGEYYRAITEYKRFLFFYPDSPRAEEARLSIARAYLAGEQFADAADAARDFLAAYPRGASALEARLVLARAEEGAGNPAGAVEQYLFVAQAAAGTPPADRAWAGLGLLHLEHGNFPAARESFLRINDGLAAGCPAEEVVKRLDEAETMPRKSPAAAGALSVIPGLGQIYVGRYQDAAFTFLLDGALIWAAAESFHDDQPALGAVLSVVAAGFYAGNIYGAAASARKFNKREQDRVINSVKQACAPKIFGMLAPEPGGFSAGLGFTF